MNPLDDQIDRLFRAARPTTAGPDVVPPFGMETRVLAAWRQAESGEGIWSTPLLMRGLLLAGLIMALSLWPVLSRSSSPDADYLQLADSTVQWSGNP